MRRRDQNQTRSEWEELKLAVVLLDPIITTVLLRGTHESGIRRARTTQGDLEAKTPPPAWSDSTGETAVRERVRDDIEEAVVGMAANIHNALNDAKKVLSLIPVDVAERSLRSIPDCSACGDPILGKTFYGRWDEKCRSRFRRWVAAGNSADEKLRFEMMLARERAATTATPSKELTKTTATLRQRGKLEVVK